MSDLAIRAETLGKQYRIGQSRTTTHPTLKDAIMAGIRAPLENLRQLHALGTFSAVEGGADVTWAIRDVSFELRHGEVLGVIGRNGAGKSTLLKILSRITEPTCGRAEVYGRVGSLLEVGTGFHPDLTGRANIYLNGCLLGMDLTQIRRKFDEIVDFSGVERFIDTPVKRYSSGMTMRLAFAVAAHLEPEIVIVDEVLAVGDAEFQRKCLGKMRDVAANGRTVLFVSHNMTAVQRLCSRVLLMDHGRVTALGDTADVVGTYLESATAAVGPDTWIDVSAADRTGTGEAQVTAVSYRSNSVAAGFRPYTGGPLEISLAVVSDEERRVCNVAVTLCDKHGTKLQGNDLALAEVPLRRGRNVICLRIEGVLLNPGTYVLALELADPVGERLDSIESAFEIRIVERAAGAPLRSGGTGAVPCQLSVLGVS